MDQQQDSGVYVLPKQHTLCGLHASRSMFAFTTFVKHSLRRDHNGGEAASVFAKESMSPSSSAAPSMHLPPVGANSSMCSTVKSQRDGMSPRLVRMESSLRGGRRKSEVLKSLTERYASGLTAQQLKVAMDLYHRNYTAFASFWGFHNFLEEECGICVSPPALQRLLEHVDTRARVNFGDGESSLSSKASPIGRHAPTDGCHDISFFVSEEQFLTILSTLKNDGSLTDVYGDSDEALLHHAVRQLAEEEDKARKERRRLSVSGSSTDVASPTRTMAGSQLDFEPSEKVPIHRLQEHVESFDLMPAGMLRPRDDVVTFDTLNTMLLPTPRSSITPQQFSLAPSHQQKEIPSTLKKRHAKIRNTIPVPFSMLSATQHPAIAMSHVTTKSFVMREKPLSRHSSAESVSTSERTPQRGMSRSASRAQSPMASPRQRGLQQQSGHNTPPPLQHVDLDLGDVEVSGDYTKTDVDESAGRHHSPNPDERQVPQQRDYPRPWRFSKGREETIQRQLRKKRSKRVQPLSMSPEELRNGIRSISVKNLPRPIQAAVHKKLHAQEDEAQAASVSFALSFARPATTGLPPLTPALERWTLTTPCSFDAKKRL